MSTAWVLVWVVLAISPVVVTVYSSVKSNTQLIADPLGWPDPWKLSNYATAWHGVQFGQPAYRLLMNSVVATVVGILVGLTAGTLAAYGVARSHSRLAELANRYFILLITVPAVVTWVPLFSLAEQLRMLSKPWALGLIYAAMTVPMAAVLMKAYFSSFPLDIIEAAQLDGNNEFMAFCRVVLPMSWGTLLTVALVQGIALWNELGLAAVLLVSPDSRTLPIGLTLFQGQNVADRADQLAAVMIMVAPVLLAYLIFQRRITEGVRLGAFK